MPDYIYHLKNGKTMTLSGDTPPSDEEVESLAKENKVELMPADEPAAPPVKPVAAPPIQQPAQPPVDERGTLRRLWDTASQPLTDLPSRVAQSASDWMTTPTASQDDSYLSGVATRAKGFAGGALEGIGNLLSGFTSPVNLATTLATAGSGTAAKAGLPTIAKGLSYAAKAAAIPMGISGGEKVVNPNSTLGERGQGLTEIAGAIMGARGMPEGDIFEKPPLSPTAVNAAKVAEGIDVPKVNPDLAKATQILKDYGAPVGKWTPEEIIQKAQAIAPEEFGQAAALPAQANDAVTTPKSQPANIIIPLDKQNAAFIKKVREAGYEFVDTNDKGGMRFKKVDAGTKQPLLESEVGAERPTQYGTAAAKRRKAFEDELAGDTTLTPDQRQRMLTGFDKAEGHRNRPKGSMADALQPKPNLVADALNAPRTILSSMDFSAPLRQGIGLVHKKQFWTSLDDMFKAFGSEKAYNAIQEDIGSRPLFKKRVGELGEVLPSFAEDAGLKLTDLTDMTTREESMMSKMAEAVPLVRRSNRAYTAFLNKLRADTFESMVDDFKVFGQDAKANKPMARDLAKFINTATGRGSLGSLEQSANALSTVLFSPRLIASRLGMMAKGTQAVFSPEVYMMSNPSVRREYLKSLMAIAGVAGTVTQLGRLAGGTVEGDPASADFGKLKLGNTRIDPYAGFQQYIVAAQRLMPQLDELGIPIGGRMKSTNTGIEYDLSNPKYGQSDRFDVLERLARSKSNPVIGFAWSLLRNKRELSGEKMDFTNLNPLDNSIAQRFIPLLAQDVINMIREEGVTPKTVTAGTLGTFGMGVQQYQKQRPH